MQVGEPLHGIGEGLLVDLGVFGADAVSNCAKYNAGKGEVHCKTPTPVR